MRATTIKTKILATFRTEYLPVCLAIWQRTRYFLRLFFDLTLAQYLYILALCIFLMFDSFSGAAVVTVIALSIEFMPIFERVWHSLAGKAILLLFYAVVANFAFSWAAGIVNDVIGVSASHFSYTLNLTILLYIPVWFVLISSFAILAAQLLVPFYLLLLLILKPLGVSLPRITHNKHFRITTLLLRVCLATALLAHLVLYILPELEKEVLQKNISQDVSIGIAPPNNEVLASDSEDPPQGEQDIKQEYLQTRYQYQTFVRHMIAKFAFEFEADAKSRCYKDADSKTVELNDYEILEIYRDKSQADGYRFEVKKCISPAFS